MGRFSLRAAPPSLEVEPPPLAVEPEAAPFAHSVRPPADDMLELRLRLHGRLIEELDKRGILKNLPVMVGGAPLNQEFADAINATSYGRDAAVSAELAKALVGKNR